MKKKEKTEGNNESNTQDSSLLASYQTGNIDDIGFVYEVRDEVVYVKGLLNAKMSEQVELIGIKENVKGIINYLDNKGVVGITVLGDITSIKAGILVRRLFELPQLSTGFGLLGRVINPVGEILDEFGDVKLQDKTLIEKIAPNIIARQPVREPLETGVKFIDSMIPIGCGQRELIIGDKKTGKTWIAIDAILNQKNKGVICIYVAIGQKKSSVARVVKVLRENKSMDYTIVVSSTAADPAALQFLAPYSGCALGEFFMDKGLKVVIIYDDLSKHAVAYRQMSLLLRRPPGREGYPGDVFYLHSRLLERAAKLKNFNVNKEEVQAGSLTALPVIETIQGDVSAYIPTNVISITDGQIFLEADLFNRGVRPAISPGISVSRVGSAAQNKTIKLLAGSLKLELAQYREMEEFARLGLAVDEAISLLLEKGKRLMQLLNQPQGNPVRMISQIVLLYGGVFGLISNIEVEMINFLEKKVLYYLNQEFIFKILNSVVIYYRGKFKDINDMAKYLNKILSTFVILQLSYKMKEIEEREIK